MNKIDGECLLCDNFPAHYGEGANPAERCEGKQGKRDPESVIKLVKVAREHLAKITKEKVQETAGMIAVADVCQTWQAKLLAPPPYTLPYPHHRDRQNRLEQVEDILSQIWKRGMTGADCNLWIVSLGELCRDYSLTIPLVKS